MPSDFGDDPGVGGHERPSDTIPHQDEVEGVIEDTVGDVIVDVNADLSTQAAVTDLAAITGGEAPTETEHNAVRTRVNLLTDVLRDAGLIPEA